MDQEKIRGEAMSKKNETVIIELFSADRIKLSEQIYKAMEAKGFKPYDYAALDMGFDLPCQWPADKACEVTIAQLVVIAQKLNLRIVIRGLDMIPRPTE